MAKKDKKNSKKDKVRDPSDVVDAVRGAVERTFQATAGGTEGARDRGRSLLDDVASAAQRLRESFDDLRVLEDVRGLRAEIEALARRVGELEKQGAKPATASASRPAGASRTTGTAARATAARTTASKRRSSAARGTARKAPAKPTAARSAARTTGAKPKPAAAKPAAASKSAASKPAASKPAASKPAASKPAAARRRGAASRPSSGGTG